MPGVARGTVPANLFQMDILTNPNQTMLFSQSKYHGGTKCPMAQLSRAVAEIKKISKVYGYIPKFLYCLRVNLSLRSKFFNQGFLKKCNF